MTNPLEDWLEWSDARGGTLEEAGFRDWLVELIRKEREEAWDEGFDRGFYRGQVLPGDRDACEAGIENPYGPNGGE